jgi:transmembrane sensor
MNSQHTERRIIAEQAAAWLEELGSTDREQRAAFLQWLKSSPLHVHELLLAARVRDALQKWDSERHMDVEELIRHARSGSNVLSLESNPNPRPQRISSRGSPRWAARIAACLIVLAMTVLAAYYFIEHGTSYATQRGEQRMVKLDDGSVVFLNTQTQIQVRYREASRDIYLDEGQALFQVQHDVARPFRVHAASAVIQAIGTQFDVRLDADRATVAVVEGSVQVSRSDAEKLPQSSSSNTQPQPARIKAGGMAIVGRSIEVKRTALVDMEAATAWRQQRLIFHNTPLEEIAREFNRYNTSPRLRIDGVAAGARRFDGSFNALRPESFLIYLAREQGLSFERRGNEVVIREK